jgi:hypothetical protein
LIFSKGSVSSLVPPTALGLSTRARQNRRFDAPKMAENSDFRQNRAIGEIGYQGKSMG